MVHAEVQGRRHLRLAFLHAMLAEYHLSGREEAARGLQAAVEALGTAKTTHHTKWRACGHPVAVEAEEHPCPYCADYEEADRLNRAGRVAG